MESSNIATIESIIGMIANYIADSVIHTNNSSVLCPDTKRCAASAPE